jgi:hypothetical protein
MNIEIAVPDGWTPALTLAMAQLLQRTAREGFPLVVPLRGDVTAEEIAAISERVRRMVSEAGLAA